MPDTDNDAEPDNDAGNDPSGRAKPDASGTAVIVDGRAWLLAAYVPRPEAVWDRLYDGNLIDGSYDRFDLAAAAVRLLWVNYDLTPDEAAAVVAAADAEDLTRAVETALFGPDDNYRTYSDWALSALWANGLDPDKVPGPLRRHVLDQLVMTGRAAPPVKFVSAAEAAAVLGKS